MAGYNPKKTALFGLLPCLMAAPCIHAAGNYSLFNLKEEIAFDEVCWCFLILLTATIIIETFTHWLDWILQGKEHFLIIVNKVYKELMILGLISFLLFCSEQGPLLDDLDHSWVISFEFAHILIFFVGVSFCLFSIIICVLVSRGRRSWDAYERYDIEELMGYFAGKKHRALKFLSGFTPKGQAVQFRLLKHVFIRNHKLPPEFHFQEYVQNVMLSNVDQVLDVEWTSWLAVALFTLAGALLNQLYEWQDDHDSSEESTHYYSSTSTEESSHHRWLGGSSSSGSEESDVEHQRLVMGVYVIPGLCLLAMEIACLLIIKNAVTRVIEAELFTENKNITMESLVGLLSTIVQKKKYATAKMNGASGDPSKQDELNNGAAEKLTFSIRNKKHTSSADQADTPSRHGSTAAAAAAAAAATGGGPKKPASLDLAAQKERAAALLADRPDLLRRQSSHRNPLEAVVKVEKKIVETLTGHNKEREQEDAEAQREAERSASKTRDANGFVSLNLEFAFPFKSLVFFQKVNDIILLLKCLYLSLICCYFAGLSLTFERTELGVILFILMLAPVVLSTLTITPRVYQSEAMLTAVARVEPEVLGDTLEKMMTGTAEMRASLIVRLRELIGKEVDKDSLKQMFDEMDANKDGTISNHEFQQALGKLGLFYSAHQFQALVHALNPDDGRLDYKHFVEMIYPKEAHWSVAEEHVHQQPGEETNGVGLAAGFAQQEALLPDEVEEGYEDFVSRLADKCSEAGDAGALEALRGVHREVLRIYGRLNGQGNNDRESVKAGAANLLTQAGLTRKEYSTKTQEAMRRASCSADNSPAVTGRSTSKIHPT